MIKNLYSSFTVTIVSGEQHNKRTSSIEPQKHNWKERVKEIAIQFVVGLVAGLLAGIIL